ncbi:MAG TPA: hypothetical protein PLT07_11450, partial [Trueperaceae bacterium]|nr:hypothetical protein [Trueperaceae bacterium]
VQVELNATGVPVTSGSCSEIYNEVAFTAQHMNPTEPLPVAKELGETALMFQVHPGLAEASLQQAADVVNDVVARATR